MIDVLAWTSLVVAIITAVWLPGCGRLPCNNRTAFSAALLAAASALFILVYPNNRNIVAMSMVLCLVILELAMLFIAPRQENIIVLLLNSAASLIGTLIGTTLLFAVKHEYFGDIFGITIT